MRELSIASAASITSREIAELVEKRHDNVKRTIETLVEQGVIVRPQIEDEPGTDAMGRPRPVQVFRFTGEQGKRDSIIVVAQLSPEFTARLVDRWQELEAAIRMPALPDFTNPVAAARAWADATEAQARAQAELAAAAPKALALDRIAAADGSLSMTDAAKPLGMKPADLIGYLHHQLDAIYRRNGRGQWRGRQWALDAGYLIHKVAVATVAGRKARRRKSQRPLRTEAPPLLEAQGDRIRYARVTAGLSQEQLAKELSRETRRPVTKSLVGQWERGGIANPVGRNMVALSHATGYAYDWLINGGPVPVDQLRRCRHAANHPRRQAGVEGRRRRQF